MFCFDLLSFKRQSNFEIISKLEIKINKRIKKSMKWNFDILFSSSVLKFMNYMVCKRIYTYKFLVTISSMCYRPYFVKKDTHNLFHRITWIEHTSIKWIMEIQQYEQVPMLHFQFLATVCINIYHYSMDLDFK